MAYKTPPEHLSAEDKVRYDEYFNKRSKPSKKQTPANKLTDAIRELVEFKYKAVTARINTTGLYDPTMMRFRHSGSTNGYEDCDCTIPFWFNGVLVGLKIAIEVKAGSDKLRDAQVKRKAKLESVGALYIEARSTLQVEQEIDAYLLRITKSQRI